MKVSRRSAISRVAFALQVALLVLALVPTPAYAGQKYVRDGGTSKSYKGTVTIPYDGKSDFRYSPLVFADHVERSFKKPLTNVKSSKPSVVFADEDVSIGPNGNGWGLVLAPKRYGTSKVTYKVANKKYKLTVKVVKPVCPVKTIKNGSKTLKGSKLTFKWNYWSYPKDVTAWGKKRKTFLKVGKKIKVTPEEGWELVSLTYSAKNKSGDGYVRKSIKNGAKIPKSCSWLTITLKNTKQHYTTEVSMFTS